MKIVKVFTKYDKFPLHVSLPVIGYVMAEELSEFADLAHAVYQSGFCTDKVLQLTKIGYGLEGVKFITYSDGVE